MGGSVSTPPIAEREMMDIASTQTKSNGRAGSNMYPEHLEGLSGGIARTPGRSRDAGSSYDVIGDIMKLHVRSSDSASLSSGADSSRYSDGVDACVSLRPSPKLRPHSTPKNRPTSCGPRLSDVGPLDASYNVKKRYSGDSGLLSKCECDTDDCTTCEIIVTKHESVVSKTILTPSRWSRTFSGTSDGSSPEHRPKWKIEVEMESTRVIDNAMEREPGDTFEASFSALGRREMKDESTETTNGSVHSNSDLTKDSFDSLSSDESKNKKKSFWAKKKKKKARIDRHKPLNSTMAEHSSTLSRNWKLWPFVKHHNGLKDINANAQWNKESIYAEKMKYLQVAARVTRLRTVDVRATLLVETPVNRLTHAQLATKTHLLSVTLNAFFHPYPNTYVEWIESVAEIIRERLEMGDISPKFAEAEIEECKVCLVLSPDASVLLCKPDCALIHDLANIAGYPVREIFVMEATDSREEARSSTPVSSTTSEQFAPIDELEEEVEECRDGEEITDSKGKHSNTM